MSNAARVTEWKLNLLTELCLTLSGEWRRKKQTSRTDPCHSLSQWEVSVLMQKAGIVPCSASAKLEEEPVWSGIETTNVIKWGWATATAQCVVGLLPGDKHMGDSVLMSTDAPDWADCTVTVFTHFLPNCYPVPPLNAGNDGHNSTIHKLIMDSHYTVK